MKRTKITEQDLWKKTRELTNLIEAFKGAKHTMAQNICLVIVASATESSHYHGLGILTETFLDYREQSKKAHEESKQANI
jgi:hypothetical protein